MEEKEIQEMLAEALYNFEDLDGNTIKGIESFEEAMLLTNNKGLVVQLYDGSEFHVTVVKSR